MSREDFVPGVFCPLPLHFNGYFDDLWYFRVFFPREDFVPGKDFVLCIFYPILPTFICGNDCIWEDFVPGGFCPLPMEFNG